MKKQKYDVIYIHPTKNPKSGSDGNTLYGIMPMGIIALLNEIKDQGFNVLGINIAIEKFLNQNFSIENFLKRIEYKVLLCDLHWYEHSYGSIYTASMSKKLYPHIPVILGGYTSTIYAKEIMNNFSDIDYIVTGDSDYTLPRLVKYLINDNTIDKIIQLPNLYYRENKKIKKSSEVWTQNSLDNLNFINTDFFLHSEYIPFITTTGVVKVTPSFWLCIARGCKFNCSYCCGANKNMKKLFNGRCNVILRSPKKIAQDIKYLTEKGIRHICISHDFEMFGKKFYQEVFKEIRELSILPGLYLECFQLPSKEFLKDILKTFDKKHTLIVISPISGNEKLRKENGKIFKNNDYLDILNFIKENNIKLNLYYTINLFKETEEQFNETISQITYINKELGLSKRSIYYQPVIVDPLAGMRELEGIKVTYNSFLDYFQYCQLPQDDFNNLGFNDCSTLSLFKKRKIYKEI